MTRKTYESGKRGHAHLAVFLLCLMLLAAVPSPAHADCPVAAAARSKKAQAPFEALSAGPIVIVVSDLDRSIAFYSKILSFRLLSEVSIKGSDYEHLEGVFGMNARVARMRLGDESIELTEYLAPRGQPVPLDSRSNDHWFQHIAIVTSDMDRAYAKLRQNKTEYASTEPQTLPDWNKEAAGIRAFYFKDPDEHVLELIQFPAGKGRRKWQGPREELFLGIDHTAIVVGDTQSSLLFYRDVLGLKVTGTSENYGNEQEHLNNVFGARLRITSLRAKDGPGVELLEYLAPRDGRIIPTGGHANDLARSQTTFIVRQLSEIAGGIESGKFKPVSPGVVTTAGGELGFGKACLIEDPDGHLVRLVENTREGQIGD